MADVGSLGEYKVVVTADYSQLKAQFDAMSNFVNSTTKVMANNLNKTMDGINATMISQLKATVDQLKKSFDGLESTTKRSGDGFKSYAKQIGEAEKAAQKCHQEITALQNKMATSSMSQADLARLDQLKAKFRESRELADSLKSAQADYNMRIKETANLEAMAAKAKKQADQEGLKALREQAKEREAEKAKALKYQQEYYNQQQRRIRQLQTQYNVAYGEINKYLQSHAKMSEAVFIRLQGKISAIAAEMQRLGAMPIVRNPLAGMNYDQYASQFSKWSDFFASLKHHLTWMASAMAIGATFGLPAKTISTIAEVEKQMAAMRQVNHDVNTSQVVLNKTSQEFIGIAQKYGASVHDIIEAGKLQLAA